MVNEIYLKKVPNFINNKELLSKTGSFFPKINPANGKILGKVTKGSASDVTTAIKSAQTAFENWSRTTVMERAELIKKCTTQIESTKEKIAKIISLETGRSQKDTSKEVKSAIEYGLYFYSEGKRYFGLTTTSTNPNRFAYMIRQPVGVTALFTPFNGPFSGMAKKIFPALLCGNTIILKSHELTPYIGILFAHLLKEAGLPQGVISVIQGFGHEVGTQIVKDPNVNLVSFTGSFKTGRAISKITADRVAKVCLELGGKNPLVVCDDADIELAVKTSVASAFIEAGQRCAAASRIIIFESVYDQFKKRIIEETEKLKVGSKDEDDICPLISQNRLEEVLGEVKKAAKNGAVLLTGGSRLLDAEHKSGFYMQPTILEKVSPKAQISQKELFGPVVILYKVSNLQSAINLANDSDFGLTSAIHTKNMDNANYFIEKVQSGVVRVNGPTHGSENHQPFGGVKFSGNGWREPGTNALDIYSEWKFVTYDYGKQIS